MFSLKSGLKRLHNGLKGEVSDSSSFVFIYSLLAKEESSSKVTIKYYNLVVDLKRNIANYIAAMKFAEFSHLIV